MLPAPAAEPLSREALIGIAEQLFIAKGFASVTVKDIAEAAQCSVGHLYKFFASKQELLDAVRMRHFDIYLDIRHRVRLDTTLRGLDVIRCELALICDHLADHRGLFVLFGDEELEKCEETMGRKARHRAEDIGMLRRAQYDGTIPADIDPEILHALIHGAVWGLMRKLAETADNEDFLRIPQLADELIFTPLEERAARLRKDKTQS